MMNGFVILAAVGVASAANAQEWRFELSNPVLSLGNPSTTITASIDHGPGAVAVAGANLDVHAAEPGWSDSVALLSLRSPPEPGQNPGAISGASVIGISVGQLAGSIHGPTPGRIEVWRAVFTVTDFSPREIGLSTETARLDVYLSIFPLERETRIPVEASGIIRIVPAPAGLALLGLGGLALARRRR